MEQNLIKTSWITFGGFGFVFATHFATLLLF